MKLKNLLKKALPVFLLGIISIIPNFNIKALTSDSFYFEWIEPKIYVNKYKNGVLRSERIQVYHRRSDGAVAYCIEPGVDFSDSTTITGYDTNQDSLSGMSRETWRKVSLLAYYGYGYGNHTDSKWYAITQYEIWKANPLGWESYWADSFKGSNISQFEAESQELLNLVNNHYKMPSFNNTTITAVVNDTITLTDTNNVLSNFEVDSSSNATVRKDGNKLLITPNQIGNITINLTKKSNRFGRAALVYVAEGVQNLLVGGSLDPLYANLQINSIGGKVTINKVDKDTGLAIAQGDATLKGATYGIYKSNGEKVSLITTNENGVVTSSMLPSQGEYYLLEESSSNGYEIDKTKYYFTITKDNLYPEVTVYEKVIERDVNFFKVYATNETGFLTGEENIKFDIYLKSKNEKVASITTDKKGFASIKLPYGTYLVKQITTSKDHYKVKDFEIIINKDTDEPYYQLLSNAPIIAKLKVIKIDSESGLSLPISNIKFKIFDIDNNDYVCQTISYPTGKKVCEYETDESGTLMTPYPLNSGNYRLEEVDQIINGYLWNTTPLEFTIGENSELINDEDYGIMVVVKIANNQVKGKIEVIKTGEKLIIENGSYHYDIVNLSNVKFNVYANEEIITKDGVKHYKKGDLVGTIISDESGYGFLDNLYLGKYVLKEVESPFDNLVMDSTKYEFEIKYKDQYTEVITKNFNILNKYKKGILDFTKVDISTGEPLPNTLIEIYTIDDELIFSGRTDSNGKIIITDLPAKEYYILEKEAPDGYKLNPEKMYFSIKKNGEIVKATLTDELIIEVPNTDANFNYLQLIIPTGLIMTGVGIIIYALKKKKKKENQSNK